MVAATTTKEAETGVEAMTTAVAVDAITTEDATATIETETMEALEARMETTTGMDAVDRALVGNSRAETMMVRRIAFGGVEIVIVNVQMMTVKEVAAAIMVTTAGEEVTTRMGGLCSLCLV